MILILATQPDSKLDLVLNLVILIIMYLQLANFFIVLVFILNYKVFHFGFKKTKYVKPND